MPSVRGRWCTIYTTDNAGTDAIIEDDDEKVYTASDDGVDEAN